MTFEQKISQEQEPEHMPRHPFLSFEESSRVLRNKTSLRIRYEAEARVLKSKVGDLESIRLRLGVSQRKMCQLLMVDPSAWNRWTKENSDAPPSVYRALAWYLALEEKYPALDVNFWIQTVGRTHMRHSEARSDSPEGRNLHAELRRDLDVSAAEVSFLKSEIAKLREENRRLVSRGLILFGFTLAVIAGLLSYKNLS